MLKYDDIITFKNIEFVYKKIRTNTKHKRKIVRFELYYMGYMNYIHNVLLSKNYHHGAYNIFIISEPKYRVIMSENLVDKIINHVISHFMLKPIIEKKLIPMNVATRENKGSKLGDYYVRKYLNKLKNENKTFYVLKCDIKKYFYTISHDRLKEKVHKIIDDEDCLKLIDEVICSTDYTVNEEIKKAIKKKKENEKLSKHQIEQLDELPLYEKGKGLAIGNMTSQLFAIFYLNDLDHYIKEQLKAKYYVRYMDDFLIFSPDKEYLKMCFIKIQEKLKEEELELNKKSCIINIKEGLSFLGYRYIVKNNKLIVKLRSQTKKRIIKKLNKLSKKEDQNFYEKSKASYWGYFKHADTKAFIKKHGWYQKNDIEEKKVV